MLNRHPRFLEIPCRRGGRSWGRKSHLTRSLVTSEDGRCSGTVQTENTVRHTKYGRIRGIWSLVRVVVRQGFYCIAVRLTKWCISQTSAMLFAPVHGGCYIISSVGIEYSCGLSVMWCILSVYTIWAFWPCHGWVSKKKKYLDRGVGGWVELYPNFFWIFGIFLTLQSP